MIKSNCQANYNGFIYLWYDCKRKMFYLGSHKGLITDGYTGSGKRFLNHYNSRPKDFKRRILEYVIGSVTDIWIREQAWLDLIKPEELNIRYFNQKLSSKGGAGPRTQETKDKIKKSSIGKSKWSDQQKKEISNRQIGIPKSNGPAISLAKKGKKTGPMSADRKSNISKGKYKSLFCDGIFFKSGKEAAAYFKVGTTCISARLRNKNFQDWFILG